MTGFPDELDEEDGEPELDEAAPDEDDDEDEDPDADPLEEELWSEEEASLPSGDPLQPIAQVHNAATATSAGAFRLVSSQERSAALEGWGRGEVVVARGAHLAPTA
ncbi:MAG: hypothetical protein HY904_20685 [Deltaproteobacteria bacterium]|nr:hypothetical protein [Deltaproteobacteria bacterium]